MRTNLTRFALLFMCMLGLHATAFAQSQIANNWYFGRSAGITFSGGAPVALTNGVMNVWEGSATMSDASGNLQFYTNGQSVWTRTHVTMPNGTGLFGDPSSTQCAAMPVPGTTDKYIIFTVAKEGGANGLRYSTVDMALNGGLGNVVNRNVALSSPVTEKITIIKHCNGRDYWVLAHKWNSNQFLLYAVTAAVPIPTLVSSQTIGMTHTGGTSNSNAIGAMKASPNSRKIALATNTGNTVELYDFDNSTGVLSNLKTIANLQYGYGVEFSPNSKFLYISAWYDIGGQGKKIYQYDISGVNPNQTYLYNTNLTVGNIALGPDGKIYVSRGDVNNILLGQMSGNDTFLGRLDNPNNNGGSYTENAVSLAGRRGDHGLPNFIPAIFIDTTKNFVASSFCYGSNTDFVGTVPSDADSVKYYFGDGFEGLGANVSHLYPGIGTYNVKMKVFYRCRADSLTKVVSIVNCASSACNSGTGCFNGNLMSNGDLENGITGFTTNYNPNNGSGTCTAGANCSGQYLCGQGYAIMTGAQPCNPNWSTNIRDHTTGAGKMMLVDFGGSQQNILCQTINLTNGSQYCFGAYYINPNTASGVQYPLPSFSYTRNGVNIGNTSSIPQNEQWNFAGVQFTETTGGAVTLCIRNLSTGLSGNDVGIDDIALREIASGTAPTANQDVLNLCSAGATTGAVNVLANDAAGSGTLTNSTLRIVQQPPFTQGTATANTATGVITFNATAAFNGPVSLQYQICNTAGCCASGTVLIDRTTATSAAPITGTTTLCNGSSTTLTASGGASYAWSNAILTAANTVSPAANTTYTVTVTSAGGCTSTTTVAVVVNTAPVIAISGTTSICTGGNTTLTASGAATYAWSNGTLTAINNVNPAINTTYTVTATAANTCTATATTAVTVSALPTATITGSSSVCNGKSTVLTASGGTTYAWNNGTATAANSVAPAANTTYTVTVTNAATCTATATQTVTVNANPVSSISGNATICNGSSTTLTANGGNTYIWSNGTATAAVSVNPNTTTTYTVTTTDNNSCTVTATQTVTVNAAPTPTISGTATICSGTTTTQNAGGGVSYIWSNGVATSANPVTPLVTTAYSVTVTNAAGCTATRSKTVTVQPSPIAGIAGPNSVCPGTNVPLTAQGGGTYLWNNGITSALQSVSPIVQTTYTVTVTSANGCSLTATKTLNINSSSVTPNVTICAGGNTALTASGVNVFSYAWNTGATVPNINVAPLTTTTYTVTITHQDGNSILNGDFANGNVGFTTSYAVGTGGSYGLLSLEGTYAVATNPNLTHTNFANCSNHTPGGGNMLVVNGSSTAGLSIWCQSVNVSQNTTYNFSAWLMSVVSSNPAVLQFSINGVLLGSPFAASPTLCNWQQFVSTWNSGANTTANICIVNQNTSPSGNDFAIDDITFVPFCRDINTVTVTVGTPTPTITGNTTVCNGANTTLTATGGNSYAWSTGSNTAATTVTPAPNTTYTVTVTASGGCTNTASQTVTVNALPTPTIVGNSTICSGATTNLAANGGTAYAWNTGDLTVGIAVTPTLNTTYTVTATNANGCTATSTQAVTVNALPIVAISGNATLCNGSNTTLTATGANTYVWNNGTPTAATQVSPVISTTYTVTATGAGNCTNTASQAVTVNTLPTIAISGTTTLCNGAITTLTATGASTYAWSNGGNTDTNTVSPGSTTTYTVTATDANGCTATQTQTVTVNALPIAAITGPTALCAGSAINITATGGANYAWNTADITATLNIAPSVSTTYTVTATSSAGCTASVSTTITVNSFAMPALAGATICATTPTTIGYTDASKTYAWNTSATTGQITIAPSTTTIYTVTTSDANGCSTSNTVTITVNNNLSPTISGINAVCIGDATSLTASIGATFVWSSGDITQTAVVTPAITTTYTVTVTSAQSCTGTQSVTVTVNLSPIPTITGNTAICVGNSTTLTAVGGAAYEWDDNTMTTTHIIAPAITTTYTVTATDSNGCSASTTVAVTVNTQPVIAISGNTAICSGNTATLTASGAATYDWGGGNTNATFTTPALTAQNTYIVAATDANGCTGTGSVTVTVNAALVPTITGNTPICLGASATLTAAGGVSYDWGGGITTATNTVTPNTNTTYTVTATDAAGCTGTASALLTIRQPPATSIAGNNTACAFANTTLTANGGSTYIWSDAAQTTNSITINPSATTTYTVTATDINSCTGTGSFTLTVTPLTPVIVTLAASTPTACAGAPITFTATPINPGAAPTYQWIVNGTPVASAGTNVFVISNLTAGTNTVTVLLTSSTVCPSGLAQDDRVVTITPTVTPTVTLAVSQNPICAGDNVTFTATVTNEGAVPTYQWSINGAPDLTAVGTTYTSNTLAANDIVTVQLTSNAACANPAAVTDAITMTVNAIVAPTISIAPTQNPICAGATALFTATYTGGGGNPTFAWTVNGIPAGSNAATFSSNTLADNDVINCTLTSSAVCAGAPMSATPVTMTINPTVSPSVTVSYAPLAVCANTPVTFTATPTNGGANPTYEWRYNGLVVSTASNVYSTSSVQSSDIITVKLTSNATCVLNNPASANISVSVTPSVIPTIAVSTPTPSFCVGSAAVFNTTITNGGSNPSYQWSINGINVVGNNSPTFSSSTLNDLDRIRCVLTSDATCALGTPQDFVVITVNPTVVPSVAIQANQLTVCAGQSFTFTAIPTNGGGTPSFTWSVNGTNLGNSNTLTTDQLQNGNIVSVTMTSSAACAATPTATAQQTIAVQMLSALTTLLNPDTCKLGRGAAFVTASSSIPGVALTYNWSGTTPTTSDTIRTLQVLHTYTVTVSDNLGCSATATARVGNTGGLSIAGLTVTPQLCGELANTGTGTVSHLITNPPYSYQWSDASNNILFNSPDSIALLAAGTYTVKVTDKSGCYDTRKAIIPPPIYPDVRISPVYTTVNIADTTHLHAIVSNNEVYTYQWSPVGTLSCNYCANPSAYPLETTTYTVTVTNSEGCLATASAVIVIDPAYNVYIPNSFTPNGDGNNDIFTVFGGNALVNVARLAVYDRWGEEVFVSQNTTPNDIANGWNGTFHGETLIQGVFVYYAEVVFANGTHQVFKGDITLVR